MRTKVIFGAFLTLMAGLAVVIGLPLIILGASLNHQSVDSEPIVVVENSSQAPQLVADSQTSDKKIPVVEVKLDMDRVVLISGPIASENSAGAANMIRSLDDGKNAIYLLLNSPGGSVVAGSQVITAMQESRSPVYTVCLQLCASMAFMIHQYGKERYMINRSIIMSHQASMGTQGEMAKIQSLVGMLLKYIHDLNVPVARRAGLTVDEYQALINNELWLEASEATLRKFNDKIIKVRSPVTLNSSSFSDDQVKKPVTDNPHEFDFQFIYTKKQ